MMLLTTSVATAAPLRLAEVLDAVEAHGPDQLAASGTIDVARASVHTARMFPNPGVSVGAGRAEPAFNGSLIFRLPIFGQRGVQRRAAEANQRQVETEATAARWRLRRDARLAYYGVVRADDEVEIAIEVEQLTGRMTTMAAERLEVGSGNRLDERQASLVHSRAGQDVNDRRALAMAARIELARQLGRRAEDIGPLADPLEALGTVLPQDELIGTATAVHPELRALADAQRAAKLRADSARADLRPTLSFEAGIELLDAVTCGGSTGYCVGPRGTVSFDLPVFNLNRGPIEHALAEAHLVELRKDAAQQLLSAEVRTAYTALSAAQVRVRFFDEDYVPNALEVEKMAREAFAAGKSGIVPLIVAERAVLDARLGRVEALFKAQSARADLEEASGVALSVP
ncbi:MAG: TolC family protein [Polyangia bacterium]